MTWPGGAVAASDATAVLNAASEQAVRAAFLAGG